MFHKVIIGIDGRAGGQDAILLARTLTPDAALVLANVYPSDMAPSRPASTAHRDALREDAQALLVRAREEEELPGARLETLAGTSPAKELDLLGRLGAEVDVLVCGSRGRGALGRVVPGSTADQLFHDGSVPVIVVPRSAVAAAAGGDDAVAAFHA